VFVCVAVALGDRKKEQREERSGVLWHTINLSRKQKKKHQETEPRQIAYHNSMASTGGIGDAAVHDESTNWEDEDECRVCRGPAEPG
jgi:hypothetical protein